MRIKQFVFIVLVFVCAACVPATPSKEDLDEQLENSIARENELWSNLNIDNYKIEVHQSSVWVNYKLVITVKNNEVISFEPSCDDSLLGAGGNTCQQSLSEISPDTYTIQGSFAELKKSRRYFEEDWGKYVTSSWSESISITFDPQYHYPKRIRFDNPDMADEEYTTEIVSFESLQK